MISICIPIHNMSGENVRMMTQLLDSIAMQTYTDYNVIVSDQSDGNEIKELCMKYHNVSWLNNRAGTRVSAANCNNAIINSHGEYIKVMFADDLFYTKDALEKMMTGIGDKQWLVCGCVHYNDNPEKTYRPHKPEIPKYRNTEKDNMKALALGENLIGNPSVMLYKRCEEIFDNPLRMLTDTDLYYRLWLRYGLPVFMNDMLINVRIHEKSQQQMCSKELIDTEKRYMKAKFQVLDLKAVD